MSEPLRFPAVAPGDAITLGRLIELAYIAADEVGLEAEIVVPASQPPLLFLFTPPAGEGWVRCRLGALLIERNGSFISEDGQAEVA